MELTKPALFGELSKRLGPPKRFGTPVATDNATTNDTGDAGVFSVPSEDICYRMNQSVGGWTTKVETSYSRVVYAHVSCALGWQSASRKLAHNAVSQ